MEKFGIICVLGMVVCAAIMVFGDTTITYKPMMLFAFGFMAAFFIFGKKKSNGEDGKEE